MPLAPLAHAGVGRAGPGRQGCSWLAVMLFLFAPLLVVVVFSFNSIPRMSLPLAGLSLQWYQGLVDDPEVRQALTRSLVAAAITALIAGPLGVMAALGLRALSERLRTVVLGAMLLPIVVPGLLLAVALAIYWNGLLGQRYSLTVAIAGHVLLALPFVILTMNAAVSSFRFSLLDAARDLGAGPWAGVPGHPVPAHPAGRGRGSAPGRGHQPGRVHHHPVRGRPRHHPARPDVGPCPALRGPVAQRARDHAPGGDHHPGAARGAAHVGEAVSEMTGALPAFSIAGVTRRFGSVTAVDDLWLDIREGEFFSLLGPSGCGKTTTLRMLAGFETPDEGTISLRGRDVTDTPPNRRDTNLVFQHYELFPHMTVFQNVAYGLRLRKVREPELTSRVREALRIVRAEELADRGARQLSGGQQQRVALARAIVNQPAVLLLDEPLSALDVKLRKQMQLELKAIQHQLGTTFVYVTHDQEEALLLSDRIGIMSGGRLLQVATPRELYDHPADGFVADFVGSLNVFDGRVAEIRGGHRHGLPGRRSPPGRRPHATVGRGAPRVSRSAMPCAWPCVRSGSGSTPQARPRRRRTARCWRAS